MKTLTAKQLISALVLSTIAVGAFAAPTNGPKPRCPLGQIAVPKNNMWVCEEPSIKAPTKPMQMTTAKLKLDKATPKKPERAKPDLSIVNMLKVNHNTPDISKFRVYVKNSKGVASPATKMSLNTPKGSGEVSVPAIAANSGQWVEISFFQFDRGDRILLEADSYKKVSETDETNNKYAFNW